MSAEEGHKYIIVGGGTAGCVLANRLTAKEVGRLHYLLTSPKVIIVIVLWPAFCSRSLVVLELVSQCVLVYAPYSTVLGNVPQENSVLVLEAGSPKFEDRNIKMPIGILRYGARSSHKARIC